MTQTAHKTKLKICLVSISLAKGGAERSVAMLSQMLSSSGHEVHIVVLNDEIDFSFDATLFNLGVYKSKKDHFLSRIVRFKKLRRYLLAQNFDAIIDHRPKNEYMRELFYRNYVYKKLPTIYVMHSANKEEYMTKKPSKMASIYNRGLATVAVSNYIKKDIAEACGVVNCTTIHNAFDPTWKNEESNVDSLPKNYILSYGRLYDAIKDFTFLIQSYNESDLWKEGVSLVIMGEGPDKSMLQELATNAPCSEHVVFLPFTKAPFTIIKRARCVTLTSRYEGFPMVLVESLSLGTPVVSLDIVSGPNEIIIPNENGLLVKERNTTQFAKSLQSICRDDLLYSQLKSNTIPSTSSYSMDAIGETWNQLLQHAIR